MKLIFIYYKPYRVNHAHTHARQDYVQAKIEWSALRKLIFLNSPIFAQHKLHLDHLLRTRVMTPPLVATTVSFATVDGGTSGTASVPTTGTPEVDTHALKTHLQSTFGWKTEDIVLGMYEPGKYVVMFDTVVTKFIRGCSVVGGYATTDADKETVQKELWEFINRNHIRVLDVLPEICSHYNITTIGDHSFRRCATLTTIVIPDGVTAIGLSAFADCTALTTVAIPESVTTIGICAFYVCASLSTVSIPDSVTTIGAYAFWGCSSLTTITIPYSVTTIRIRTFANCTSLSAIHIPDSVTTIGDYAFGCCVALSAITIPASVTTIGASAFWRCPGYTPIHATHATEQVTGIDDGCKNHSTNHN